MLRLAEKAFWPGQLPVPGDARRHRPQLPRGPRVPRPPGGRGSARGWSWPPCRTPSTTAGSTEETGPRASRNRLQTVDAARRHRGARLRRRLRRRPPRRGEGPGQGAGVLLPRRVRPVGPEEPAARAVEPLQRPAPQGRAHPGLPDLATGPSSTSGSTSPRRSIELPSIYFAHEREVFQRDGMLLAVSEFVTAAGATRSRSDHAGPLPHRRRRVVHRRRRVHGAAPSRTSSPRSPPPGSPSAAPPAPTTGSARPPWKTASRRATSDASCCASPRPARSTTASPPSSGGCSTTRRRSSRTSSRRSSAPASAMGDEYTNLALLTDGLRAEREQGITIDVAYRYFATPKRKFIIADTPGHIQYTRNMVTGASTADLALILVDARKGIVEQSRRHAFLAVAAARPAPRAVRQQDGPRRLVRGPVRGDQGRVPRVRHQARHRRPHVHPGLGAARRQRRRPLGEHALVRGLVAAAPPRGGAHRVRPQPHRRPLPGAVRDPPALRRVPRLPGLRRHVAGGVFKPGDEVVVLPSGFTSTIASIDTVDGPVDEAFAPMSVTIRLDDEIDISPRRHDLPAAQPAARSRQDIDAMVCWMTDAATLGAAHEARHQAHDPHGPRMVKDLQLPPRRQHAAPRRARPTHLPLNEIGRVSLRTTLPLFFDEYRRNRDDRQLHPHRRGHERHRRRRDDPRADAAVVTTASRDAATNVTWHAGEVTRGRPPLPRGDRLAHRAVGLGQVDRGRRARAAAGQPAGGRPTGSTATTCATGSTPTSASPTADRDRERAPGRRGGPAPGRRRRGGHRPAHQPVPRRPRPGPGAARRGRPRRSSRSSSTPRSSCASSATPRASTPRPAPARSPASPASTTPTRRRSTPELVLTPADGNPAAQAEKVASLLQN